ncbi:chymotrypsin-2-like isoform X2 [Venturia canescens]|uniref:chymotrypsin-2-like isoform X2 n=1 Tax=Venturia canescens TaxID=32260 RepID=UPI001C9C5DF8|nr:chymotrypsin-2-like isoform X2 [Venturia canescens]
MVIRYGFLLIASVVFLGTVTNALPPKKIIGGQRAAPGEFPYQVSLRIDGKHMCGGAIISKRHILTAAHCVVGVTTKPYTNIVVVTGSVKSRAGQTHVVKSVMYNPLWVRGPVGIPNDIAIVQLARDMHFDANQREVALPKLPTPGGMMGTVTGWGYLAPGALVTAEDLMKLQVKSISASECHSLFAGMAQIHPQQICSLGMPGRGFCQGDSGGPFVVNNQLVGIVSFNVPCAKGLPDVYTSVYHFLDWIDKAIKLH